MVERIRLEDDSTSVPLEEITSDGTGSGLEAEPDDVSVRTPFAAKDIDVVTLARTVDLLLIRLKEGELDLSPDFQRRSNLWNEPTKSALIESMLLGIPIPSLYVAENAAGNYTVVDGLQRLCAIAHFVNVEELNKAVGTKLNPLCLSKLESLKAFEGKVFSELPRPLKRRINETELTLHVIRASTPPAVKFNIFSRINRGGLPLTAQEIRNAIYSGEWKKHVRAMAESSNFRKATQGKIKGERMEDLELILRFVALYSLPKGVKRSAEQNLDTFLNEFVETLSVGWPSQTWDGIVNTFNVAMQFAPKIFGEMAFRKYWRQGQYRRPINRGLFETESVAIARLTENERAILSGRSTQVKERFGWYFENDKGFGDALLYATGRGVASNKRLETIEAVLKEVLNA